MVNPCQKANAFIYQHIIQSLSILMRSRFRVTAPVSGAHPNSFGVALSLPHYLPMLVSSDFPINCKAGSGLWLSRYRVVVLTSLQHVVRTGPRGQSHLALRHWARSFACGPNSVTKMSQLGSSQPKRIRKIVQTQIVQISCVMFYI